MKLLLKCTIAIFLLISFQGQAQNPHETKCKMNLEQILLAQTFDIDDPKSEYAKSYVEQIFKDLSSFYSAYNQGQSAEIQQYISSLESLLRKSEELGMNCSMFKKDFQFIQSLK